MGSKITFWKQMRGLLSTIPAAAGVMPTARLGSGTASSASYLRGDQTYQLLTTMKVDLGLTTKVTLVGTSDTFQIDTTPFATQTVNQQVWRNTAGSVASSMDANGRPTFTSGSFSVTSTFNATVWNGGQIGWTAAGAVTGTSTFETGFARDGAGRIAARFGTTAHTLRVYNTYTSATVYERGVFDWTTTTNTLRIGTEKGSAGGTARDLVLVTDSVVGMTMEATTRNVGLGVTPTAALHIKAGTTAASTAPLKFTAGPVNTTPESGAMEYDGDSLYFTEAGVRRYVTLGNDIRVTSSTVTNTVTETTIHTSAIAANELKAGKMYRMTLLGKATTFNATHFFTLRYKMGGTTLITVAMTAAAITDGHFTSTAYVTIRTAGVGGTYAAHVEGAIDDELIGVTPVTGSVDTTVSEDMTITLQWDAANAGNVFTIMQAVLEVVG